MDSLDAQCLLMRLTDGEVRPPDLWRHDSSGALSCAYEGSDRTFTWPAEAVAQMARTWRDSDTSRASAQARLFRDAHQRLDALASEAGLGPADVMIHDLGRAELRGIWDNEEVILVVEEICEAAAPVSATSTEKPAEAGSL
jgi:NAD(P)-dependent dehydrogenase (short-subunit alcohol dehydrogenase family)